MIFVKERNFIVAYDGVLKLGSWNITTGQFIGKSGKPVKSVPACFTYNNLPVCYNTRCENGILLGYIIRRFREWQGSWHFDYNETRGNRLEQLISVGLYPSNFDYLDEKTSLTKDLVTFLKENNGAQYDVHEIQKYFAEKKYADFLAGKSEWIKSLFKCTIDKVPYDYLKTFLNRMEHEHVDAFYSVYSFSSTINLILRYYEICNTLYQKVEVKPNILSNYAHLLYLEKEYKDAHYNEVLKEKNNCPWLYFQNDKFIVRPLLTREAFHEEGERQSNCVERMYMERVYNGITHVVTVRRVENPDKNYITCEVNNLGRIIQYLARANSHPTEQDAKEFKAIYQTHLTTAIKE